MGIFDNASSITIGGKEVKSIEIDGGVIYSKEEEDVLILKIHNSINGGTGTLTGEDIVIDWGDGTVEPYSDGNIKELHTYQSEGDYTIKIRGVTGISENFLQYCTNLYEIVIPSTITSLPTWAIGGCGSLDSVTLPNTLTSIGQSCFYSTTCGKISIPSSVTLLKPLSVAMENTVIYFEGQTPPTCETATHPRLGTLTPFTPAYNKEFYVPRGSKSAYLSVLPSGFDQIEYDVES